MLAALAHERERAGLGAFPAMQDPLGTAIAMFEAGA
jgi:hypothetical protein